MPLQRHARVWFFGRIGNRFICESMWTSRRSTLSCCCVEMITQAFPSSHLHIGRIAMYDVGESLLGGWTRQDTRLTLKNWKKLGNQKMPQPPEFLGVRKIRWPHEGELYRERNEKDRSRGNICLACNFFTCWGTSCKTTRDMDQTCTHHGFPQTTIDAYKVVTIA